MYPCGQLALTVGRESPTENCPVWEKAMFDGEQYRQCEGPKICGPAQDIPLTVNRAAAVRLREKQNQKPGPRRAATD